MRQHLNNSGWLLGLGQIATKAMTGQRWDRGLLLNVGLSLLTEGTTTCVVRGVGWVAADNLQVGEHVRKADGSYGAVQAVKRIQRLQRMYNLTVDRAHTFFVGQQRWLVHNT